MIFANYSLSAGFQAPVIQDFNQIQPIQSVHYTMDQPNFYYWLMFNTSTFFWHDFIFTLQNSTIQYRSS